MPIVDHPSGDQDLTHLAVDHFVGRRYAIFDRAGDRNNLERRTRLIGGTDGAVHASVVGEIARDCSDRTWASWRQPAIRLLLGSCTTTVPCFRVRFLQCRGRAPSGRYTESSHRSSAKRLRPGSAADSRRSYHRRRPSAITIILPGRPRISLSSEYSIPPMPFLIDVHIAQNVGGEFVLRINAPIFFLKKDSAQIHVVDSLNRFGRELPRQSNRRVRLADFRFQLFGRSHPARGTTSERRASHRRFQPGSPKTESIGRLTASSRPLRS